MPDTAAKRTHTLPTWPLTSDARLKLIDEIALLHQDLRALTGQGLEEGIVQLPVALAARRLETLKAVLERAEVVAGDRCAIGRRATVRDAEGVATSYEIVFPGDGDPAKGQVSADSPLGGAILGAEPGDVVEVPAPAGPWSVTVVGIE